mmetsp:Transcript_55832/g.155666  ORF Transcript_55832/g.155666 Transcript_55832/m.155666 type:complete len:208 (-) Transcript_55832:211-834(-)
MVLRTSHRCLPGPNISDEADVQMFAIEDHGLLVFCDGVARPRRRLARVATTKNRKTRRDFHSGHFRRLALRDQIFALLCLSRWIPRQWNGVWVLRARMEGHEELQRLEPLRCEVGCVWVQLQLVKLHINDVISLLDVRLRRRRLRRRFVRRLLLPGAMPMLLVLALHWWVPRRRRRRWMRRRRRLRRWPRWLARDCRGVSPWGSMGT